MDPITMALITVGTQLLGSSLGGGGGGGSSGGGGFDWANLLSSGLGKLLGGGQAQPMQTPQLYDPRNQSGGTGFPQYFGVGGPAWPWADQQNQQPSNPWAALGSLPAR